MVGLLPGHWPRRPGRALVRADTRRPRLPSRARHEHSARHGVGRAPAGRSEPAGRHPVQRSPAGVPDQRRRPTANPSSAPPTINTMITTRMNLPTPARKPRASSSAANRPTWVAAKVMTVHAKALRAAQSLGVSLRTHIHSHRTNRMGDANWSAGDLSLPRRRLPCRGHRDLYLCPAGILGGASTVRRQTTLAVRP